VPKRHRIEVSFGEPIAATGDPTELMDRVRGFFENGGSPSPYRSPYRYRATASSER
jgi:hypothetical protein